MLVGAALCFALFIYTTVVVVRYSPLYIPMECHQEESGLGAIEMTPDFFNTSGSMKKRCINQNAYDISIEESSVGEVWVMMENDTMLSVGSARVPAVTFPAGGEAIGVSSMEISVPAPIYGVLLGKPLLQIVSEIHVASTGGLSFLGMTIASSEPKDEVCGFEIKIATQKVGPSACARSRAELVIPSVDSKPAVAFVQLSPAGLIAQSSKKNLSFGFLMAVSFALAIVLTLLGVLRMRGSGTGDKLPFDSDASSQA